MQIVGRQLQEALSSLFVVKYVSLAFDLIK